MRDWRCLVLLVPILRHKATVSKIDLRYETSTIYYSFKHLQFELELGNIHGDLSLYQ